MMLAKTSCVATQQSGSSNGGSDAGFAAAQALSAQHVLVGESCSFFKVEPAKSAILQVWSSCFLSPLFVNAAMMQ